MTMARRIVVMHDGIIEQIHAAAVCSTARQSFRLQFHRSRR